MTLAQLHRALRRHAVQLALTPVGTLQLSSPGRLPAALVAAAHTHREALVRDLTAGFLPPLPDALQPMIQAAVVSGLPYPATLPSGQVDRLGDYILACAALYAAGIDPHRQLVNLWSARRQWAA